MRQPQADRSLSDRVNSGGGAPLPRIAVIGAGRAGRALTRAAEAAGLEVELAGREASLDAGARAEVALLCVPDAAIVEVCERLAGEAVPPLRLVGHVSGATGLDALAAARAQGCEVFSLHPLQTLPDGDAELASAACAVSGSSAEATDFALDLAMRLGLRPFELEEELRAAYHAAASMASNYLVALEESAADLLGRAGVEAPRDVLAPLVLRTAANWAERGEDALTGPIARGDDATVQRHLEALAEAAPELIDAYRALAERTRAVARKHEVSEAAA
jgi:predicted short-subunit dehydrogenase-like oxidoreductase (DUF2520 family)